MKLFLLGLLLVGACSSSAMQADAGGGDDGSTIPALRVLFVGNSYVHVNDLPAVLSRIATTAGANITVDSIAPGGADFVSHVSTGDAVARIAEGGWTHVVLQDQSVTPVLRYFNVYTDHLGEDAEAAKLLGDHVVAAGAVPVWYATWARAASDVDGFYATYGTNPTQMQDLLTSAYARFAEAVPGSVVACVGEAFRRSLVDHPAIALHQLDGSHPTLAGTYLAASTLYVALTGHPVPDASEAPAEIAAADASALREMALVGSTCAGYRAPAIIRMSSDTFLAGASQRRFLFIENRGDSSAGLSDGQTLAAPFSWSSGSFPGYDDPRVLPVSPPCGAQLLPSAHCSMAVTFSGTAPGTSTLTIDLTGAYETQVSAALQGATTDQPLLELYRDPSTTTADLALPLGSTPDVAVITAHRGETAVFHLLLTNVGGSSPTTLTGGSIGSSSFNDAVWSWGPVANPAGAFPGGSGTITLEGTSRSYCGDTLAAGATCVITASFTPPIVGQPPIGGWQKWARVITEDAAQTYRARISLEGYVLD